MTEDSDRLQERGERVQVELDKRPRIVSVGQRIILAQNLWKILEELEKHRGVRKRDILARASLGSSTSSTKSLYNYALDPSTGDLSSSALDRRLIKNVAKYLNILRAAASLVGLPVDYFLVRFVEGSEYDVSLESQARFNENTTYRDISTFLNQLGQRLEEKYQLGDYYRYVAHHSILFNETKSAFENATFTPLRSSNPFSNDHGLASWESRYSVLRYGPFLHICDYNVAEFLSAKFECRRAEDDTLLDEGSTTIHLYKRLFVGHLPVGTSGEAQLCFVEEIHTDLHDVDAAGKPQSLYGLPGVGRVQRLDPVVGAEAIVFDVAIQSIQAAQRGDFLLESGNPTSIHAVSPASCRQFLSRHDQDGRLDFGAYSFSFCNEIITNSDHPSNAPAGTVAERLDMDLFRTDPEWRFDNIYARRIEILLGALTRFRSTVESELSTQRAAVVRSHAN